MIVGYARTSTVEQVAGFEAQDRELRAVGAEQGVRRNRFRASRLGRSLRPPWTSSARATCSW